MYRTQRAQFKLGIITAIVYDLYQEPTAIAYARNVCNTVKEWPDGSEFAVDPKTILKWASKYKKIFLSETPETAGAAMRYLMGKERSDKGESRALNSSEARARIAALLTEYPYITGKAIWRKLKDEGLIGDVSVRAVQRYLVAQQLKTGRDLTAEDRKKFEAGSFGEIWQADTMETLSITEDGKTRKTYCIEIIDDHTRLIVAGGMFYADNAYNFQKVFKKAVFKYGAPLLLYTDHGGPYENKQLSLICGSLGTALRHPRVRDGAAKGKIERLHNSMNMYFFDYLKAEDISSLTQLDNLYQEAVVKYNHTKHSSIDCTPEQRYEEAPSVAARIDVDMLNIKFMNREMRVVQKDNTLKIFKTWFDVPPGFAGQKVEVRYTPGTTEGMFVYHNEKKYPIKKTDLVKNCHTPRKARPPIPAPGKKRANNAKLTENQSKDQSATSVPERKTSPAPSIFAADEQDVAKAKGRSRRKRRGG